MNAVRFFSLMGLIALAAWMDAKQGDAVEPPTANELQVDPLVDSLHTPDGVVAHWD